MKIHNIKDALINLFNSGYPDIHAAYDNEAQYVELVGEVAGKKGKSVTVPGSEISGFVKNRRRFVASVEEPGIQKLTVRCWQVPEEDGESVRFRIVEAVTI